MGSRWIRKFGRASYIFNPTIAGIDQADGLMIIGANPRREAPVLNARIRKRWRTGALKIGLIGERADLTYDYTYLGSGAESLAKFAEHPQAGLQRQIWLIGQGALARPDGRAILSLAAKAAVSVAPSRTAGTALLFCIRRPARVGALDLGFVAWRGWARSDRHGGFWRTRCAVLPGR